MNIFALGSPTSPHTPIDEGEGRILISNQQRKKKLNQIKSKRRKWREKERNLIKL